MNQAHLMLKSPATLLGAKGNCNRFAAHDRQVCTASIALSVFPLICVCSSFSLSDTYSASTCV